MEPTKQRIAIAEACGVRLFVLHKPIHDPFGYYRENACGYTGNITEAWRVTAEVARKYATGRSDEPDRVIAKPAPAPDYLNDLNAITAALTKLCKKFHLRCYCNSGLDGTWECVLTESETPNCIPCDGDHYGSGPRLTDAMCEAFLRTIGKWEE